MSRFRSTRGPRKAQVDVERRAGCGGASREEWVSEKGAPREPRMDKRRTPNETRKDAQTPTITDECDDVSNSPSWCDVGQTNAEGFCWKLSKACAGQNIEPSAMLPHGAPCQQSPRPDPSFASPRRCPNLTRADSQGAPGPGIRPPFSTPASHWRKWFQALTSAASLPLRG